VPEGLDAGDPYVTCWATDPGPEGDPTACIREVESRLIADVPQQVRRRGGRLEVRAEGTVIAEFEDRAEEGDAFVRHRYAGWLPAAGQHLVLADFYEGRGVIAVDGRTGRTAELLGLPVVSPDGARVATANVDLVATYTESGLQVWRRTADGLELEWALDGGGRWGGSAPRWLANDRLGFVFNTLDPTTMELLGRPATLELRDDGIRLRLDR
jgi:hypothetical protein